jgi:hypothetical protein
LQADSQAKFSIQEVSFHEKVEIADEEFGDALDSLELGDAAGATAAAARSEGGTPALMAQPGAPAAASPPAAVAEATSVPEARLVSPAPGKPGFLQRLLGWLLGR